MFVGLVETREPRPDPERREPLWLDIPELRPWRWFLATVVCFVVASFTGGWVCLAATMLGLFCVLYGVSTYCRGNDGLSKYRQ